MKMTRSREILATVLQIVTAVCTAALIFSFVFNFSLSNASYFEKSFPTSEVVAECDRQLTAKYEVLAEESGYPIRVFEMVKQNTPTAQSVNNALSGAFSEGNGSVYSQNLVDYFYTLCEEYASGNNIKYDKNDLAVTAEKAASIYDETVGIHNVELSAAKIAGVKKKVTLTQFLTFVVIVISGFSTVIMYGRKRLGYNKLLGGTMAGGIGAAAASLMLRIANPVANLNIAPAAYLSGFSTLAGKTMTTVALVAGSVAIASLTAMIIIEKKYQSKKDKVKIV